MEFLDHLFCDFGFSSDSYHVVDGEPLFNVKRKVIHIKFFVNETL